MEVVCRIELFGGLRLVRGDEVTTRFPTQKAGLLLAYLALSLGRPRSREQIIDVLWPDLEPDAGRNNLSTLLSLLRRALEPKGTPTGAILQADRQAVALNTDNVQTDVAEFDALCQRAERAPEPDARLQCWHQAIALASGELLPGCYEDWALNARTHTLERRAQSLRLRAGLLLDLRRHNEARADAALALDMDACDEDACRLQMRALAASGRVEAAMQAYARLERALLDSVAAKPSRLTRDLYARLRDAPDSFVVSPSQALPVNSEAVSNDAPDDAPSVMAPPIPASPPVLPVEVTDAFPLALPPSLTRFFGREREQQELNRMLCASDTRLITLLGAGGAGKTRLALELARQSAPQYKGRVWFVALADAVLPSQILTLLHSALALPAAPGDPLEAVITALTGTPALLILDNMEHLLPDGEKPVRRLLQRLPDLVCLVTSRHALGLEGEQEYALPPLAVPDERTTAGMGGPTLNAAPVNRAGKAGKYVDDGLLECASVRLYVDRAQKAKADFALTAQNAHAVAALCRRLEGMPLAIEMAAAWIKTLPPARMLTRLERQLDLLVSRRRDLPPRQQSLRATCEWSYNLLSPELRQAFARLSVFRGGWTLDAALELIGPDAPHYLAELGARSLLYETASPSDPEEETRYRLLEPLREFAGEKLAESDEADRIAAQHTRYFLQMASDSRAAWDGPQQAAAFERLERDHDNIRAALTCCAADVGGGMEGLRAVAVMQRFWRLRGYLAEARQRTETALAHAGAQDMTTERAQALNCLGMVAWMSGDYPTATAYFTNALDAFRGMDNLLGMARTLGNLGNLAEENADNDRAQSLQEQSLALYRQLGDVTGMAMCMTCLANIAANRSDFDAAWELQAQCVAIYREQGNRENVCNVLIGMAFTACHQGRTQAARRCLEESLPLVRYFRNPQEYAYALGAAANILFTENNLALSARLYGAMYSARARNHIPLPPQDSESVEAAVSVLRATLGETVCAALMAEGASYTDQQALEAVF